MRRLFDTLAARTALVSLIGITLVHLLSLWTYEQAIDHELDAAFDAQIAERLVTIRRSIIRLPPAERDEVAHSLSSGPLDVHWSATRGVAPGGEALERWRRILPELRKREPGLTETDVVLGTLGGNDPHLAAFAVRLPDDTWLNAGIFAGRRARESAHGSVASTTLMALGVLLLSLFIARWLGRPIRTVVRAVETLSPERPAAEVPETGPQEVRALASAVNRMQARISDLVRRRTQALAAVSHDLRTPLTRLKLRLEDVADPQMRQAMTADIEEMEQMVEATLSYLKGGAEAEPVRPLDVSALLATILDNATDRGLRADLHAPPRLVIEGRIVSLRRAFSNLVDNALRFGSQVVVTAETTTEGVRVVVADDGPGIPENELAHVLEPFVRLEGSRNRETGGVGLGLTIARSAIEAQGGRLQLSNRPEGGLAAEVILPLRLPRQ
jgi:signal transduction histidine kinase